MGLKFIVLNLLCLPLVIGFSLFFILIVGFDLLIVIIAAVAFGIVWFSIALIWAVLRYFIGKKPPMPSPMPTPIPAPKPSPAPTPFPQDLPDSVSDSIAKIGEISEGFEKKAKNVDSKSADYKNEQPAKPTRDPLPSKSTDIPREAESTEAYIDNAEVISSVEKMKQEAIEGHEGWKRSLLERREQEKMEFEETQRAKREQHEENMKKLEEEIRELQREIEENEIRSKEAQLKFNAAFFYCILLEKRFEKKEQELSEWLTFIKNFIAMAVRRFELMKKVEKSLKKKTGRTYNQVMGEEFKNLHPATLTAYATVYGAWQRAKNLLEEFPDRIFLAILKKSFQNIADRLCTVLELIDNQEQNQTVTLDEIQKSFDYIEAHGVPLTWQLRDTSKTAVWEDYGGDEQPRVYTSN